MYMTNAKANYSLIKESMQHSSTVAKLSPILLILEQWVAYYNYSITELAIIINNIM